MDEIRGCTSTQGIQTLQEPTLLTKEHKVNAFTEQVYTTIHSLMTFLTSVTPPHYTIPYPTSLSKQWQKMPTILWLITSRYFPFRFFKIESSR